MDSPPLSYHDATLADLPAIVAIYNSTVASRQVTADTEPVSVASRRAWLAEHTPDHHPLWVVSQAGQVVGWVSFQAFYGRPAYAATAEISVYLAESARGRGLGKLILQHCLTQAPALGIRTLLGFIFAHNTASLQLFQALGFAEWGHLPHIAQLDGIERSLTIVGKRLAAA